MSSNESQLLRAAFIPTFLTSGFAILISTFVKGFPGFLGAVLAQFVVVIFFIIHIAVSRMTRNLDPISTMAMALFSYFAKLFALGLLLWAIATYTDRSTIDRTTFGIQSAYGVFSDHFEWLRIRSLCQSFPDYGQLYFPCQCRHQ